MDGILGVKPPMIGAVKPPLALRLSRQMKEFLEAERARGAQRVLGTEAQKMREFIEAERARWRLRFPERPTVAIPPWLERLWRNIRDVQEAERNEAIAYMVFEAWVLGKSVGGASAMEQVLAALLFRFVRRFEASYREFLRYWTPEKQRAYWDAMCNGLVEAYVADGGDRATAEAAVDRAYSFIELTRGRR